jgi:hypothetical protein
VVRSRAPGGRLRLAVARRAGRTLRALRDALDADEAGRTLTADDPFEAHGPFSLNSRETERV